MVFQHDPFCPASRSFPLDSTPNLAVVRLPPIHKWKTSPPHQCGLSCHPIWEWLVACAANSRILKLSSRYRQICLAHRSVIHFCRQQSCFRFFVLFNAVFVFVPVYFAFSKIDIKAAVADNWDALASEKRVKTRVTITRGKTQWTRLPASHAVVLLSAKLWLRILNMFEKTNQHTYLSALSMIFVCLFLFGVGLFFVLFLLFFFIFCFLLFLAAGLKAKQLVLSLPAVAIVVLSLSLSSLRTDPSHPTPLEHGCLWRY